MASKGKERAKYEDEEGEEEGGIMEEGESAELQDGDSPADGSEDAKPAKRSDESEEPIEKRPTRQEVWTPKHVLDPPRPPTKQEREAEIALLEAQARAGAATSDPRAKARIKPRRTVDYFGPITRWKLLRTLSTCPSAMPHMRPQPNYVIDLMPPAAYPLNASTSLCTKYVHTSMNKIKTPVSCLRWTPEGRRVITGSASGEFTLWNGLTFNFETILQAHDFAVRCFEWSHAGSWLVSCDNGGIIKYFQPNYNNVSLFNGHTEPIRDISFAPDDQRFVTGSDDGSVKIWDFERREMEKSLTGHGYDVKCVKWHPTKSLLVSGSKNNLIKFWDPRTGTDLRTLHDHKNSVNALSWSPNGNMVASASRDQSVKVFDIRMMKEIQDFRGHQKEACSVVWHPIHQSHLVSGGSDGSLYYWHLDSPTPADHVEYAHDHQIWALAFHPLGHLLASGSNDTTTRWWSRGRPGVNIVNDRFHVGRDKAKELGAKEEEDDNDEDEFANALPGLNTGNRGYGPGQNAFGGTGHMPNFAIPSANTGAPSMIPGLDPSGARPPPPGGIPGLAAVQQLAASMNQQNAPPQYGGYGQPQGGHRYDGRQQNQRYQRDGYQNRPPPPNRPGPPGGRQNQQPPGPGPRYKPY